MLPHSVPLLLSASLVVSARMDGVTLCGPDLEDEATKPAQIATNLPNFNSWLWNVKIRTGERGISPWSDLCVILSAIRSFA